MYRNSFTHVILNSHDKLHIMDCFYLNFTAPEIHVNCSPLQDVVIQSLPTREPLPSSSDTGLTAPAFSAHAGSSQALGLGLGGNPESGLSSPLSALQLMSSGSSSQTFGKFNLPTISSEKLLNSSERGACCDRETFPNCNRSSSCVSVPRCYCQPLPGQRARLPAVTIHRLGGLCQHPDCHKASE